MKKTFKILLSALAGGLLLIFVLFIYLHFERSNLDSVIIINSEAYRSDSLVNIKIDKTNRVFIDGKYSNIDFWKTDIQSASKKRINDTVLILLYDKTVPG
jgi:hypothetical protein